MCVAAPGIVTNIMGNKAEVDYNGNKVMAHTGIIPVKIGDYVLVHAGMVIQILKKNEAEEMAELFKELEEL